MSEKKEQEITKLQQYENALNKTYFDLNYGYFYRQISYRYYFQQAEYARINGRNTAWSWRNHVLLEHIGENAESKISVKANSAPITPNEYYDNLHLLRPNGPAMPVSLKGAVIDDVVMNGVKVELGLDRSLRNQDFYQFIPENYSIQQSTLDYSYIVDECDSLVLNALRKEGVNADAIGIFSVKTPVYETIFSMVSPNSKISYIGPMRNIYEVADARVDNAGDAETFDVVFCDSALSNYGFGRYHEEEDQENGDLRLFETMVSRLNAKGSILVILPVCEDYFVQNIGRFYGAARLQKLFEGFEIVYQHDLSRREFFETNFQMKEILFCLKKNSDLPTITDESAL